MKEKKESRRRLDICLLVCLLWQKQITKSNAKHQNLLGFDLADDLGVENIVSGIVAFAFSFFPLFFLLCVKCWRYNHLYISVGNEATDREAEKCQIK